MSARMIAGIASAAVLSMLAGCQAMGPLSASASIVVEVDVYKGPLNNSKTVQLGELVAVFDEADTLLGTFAKHAEVYNASCNEPDARQLCDVAARVRNIQSEIRAFPRPRGPDGMALSTSESQTLIDGDQAASRNLALGQLNEAAACDPKKGSCDEARGQIAEATQQATRIAIQLKVEAFYWAESQIGRMTVDPAVRLQLVNYINLASELANQISSRTDVLAKQLENGTDGTTLALSDHLKDAGPTDFLHLYEWYNATLSDPQQNGDATTLTPADRARLARQLFSDHYWTQINQVHASGQGEVRMALVKDDIGNWSLKSFDSDPEKLLGAYRELALAGIEAGIRTGKAISSGGGSAGLDLASQFARGRLGSTETAGASAQRIEAMRARAVADLVALQNDVQANNDTFVKADALAQAKANAAGAALVEATSKFRQAQDANAAQQSRVDQARQESRPAAEQDALAGQLTTTIAQEQTSGDALAQAQANETAASTELAQSRVKWRDYMSGIFASAKQSIEVHRRVIDSLKDLQGSATAGR